MMWLEAICQTYSSKFLWKKRKQQNWKKENNKIVHVKSIIFVRSETNGLVQNCCISKVLTMEIPKSCANPSIQFFVDHNYMQLTRALKVPVTVNVWWGSQWIVLVQCEVERHRWNETKIKLVNSFSTMRPEQNGWCFADSNFWRIFFKKKWSGSHFKNNKANLRDLIAATGLVFLLKIVNHQFFSLCDHEIWWMTSKNIRAPFLYYFKFFASFQTIGEF